MGNMYALVEYHNPALLLVQPLGQIDTVEEGVGRANLCRRVNFYTIFLTSICTVSMVESLCYLGDNQRNTNHYPNSVDDCCYRAY